MIFAVLLALTGLTISAVAIYYSVIGLTAIFAAAFWPIIVMGVSLELAKLVAASWLKAEWHRIPRLLKTYLSSAVIVLMVITSMGIFGFLSKAHLDQNIVSGDVVDKVAILDEKIKTQKDNIEAARKALKQMDESVDQTMARSNDEKGADKAAALRRSQQRERSNLQNDISKAQAEIAKLNEQRAPIAKDLRKVEAEVGPIKYIAKLIYGDNPDANILEKAVTWVIILIVFVFDPLAVLLLISAQMAYAWHRQSQGLEPNKFTSAYTYEDFEKPTKEELAEVNEDESPKTPEEEFGTAPEGYEYRGTWPFPLPVEKQEPPTGEITNPQHFGLDKVTVDSTEKTVDEKELYEQGSIDNLNWETVEQLDNEKAEEDLKKKTTYMIKDHGQQIVKTKDQ